MYVEVGIKVRAMFRGTQLLWYTIIIGTQLYIFPRYISFKKIKRRNIARINEIK